MVTIYARKILLDALYTSKDRENLEIADLSKKIREREIKIRVLDAEIRRIERIIEKEAGGTLELDTPDTYSHQLKWSDKIAYVLKNEENGLTTAQIAHALKSIDDELITWDNPTLVGRICAIIGVNRQNRFYRDGKVVKLKKAELTAS